ncbi:MAG: hypothetical protein WCH79_17000 [Planctomycetia bacterium]
MLRPHQQHADAPVAYFVTALHSSACARHLFIPDLVPGTITEAGEDFVTYRVKDGSTWINDAREAGVASC